MKSSNRDCGVNQWTSAGCVSFRSVGWARLTIMVKTRPSVVVRIPVPYFRISVLYRQLLLRPLTEGMEESEFCQYQWQKESKQLAYWVHAAGVIIERYRLDIRSINLLQNNRIIVKPSLQLHIGVREVWAIAFAWIYCCIRFETWPLRLFVGKRHRRWDFVLTIYFPKLIAIGRCRFLFEWSRAIIDVNSIEVVLRFVIVPFSMRDIVWECCLPNMASVTQTRFASATTNVFDEITLFQRRGIMEWHPFLTPKSWFLSRQNLSI